jgi:hypothetical protein
MMIMRLRHRVWVCNMSLLMMNTVEVARHCDLNFVVEGSEWKARVANR